MNDLRRASCALLLRRAVAGSASRPGAAGRGDPARRARLGGLDRSVCLCETGAMSLSLVPGSSPGAFDTGITLAGFVIGVIVVGMVVLLVVKVVAARKRGINPLTFDAELAAKLRDSSVLQPEKSVEARLAELDDLHGRGVITDAERDAARATVLRGR